MKEFKQGKINLTVNHNRIYFHTYSFKLEDLNNLYECLREAKEHLQEKKNGTN